MFRKFLKPLNATLQFRQ